MKLVPFIKYFFVAQILKFFSSGIILQKYYRNIANKYGQKRHSLISDDDFANVVTVNDIVVKLRARGLSDY